MRPVLGLAALRRPVTQNGLKKTSQGLFIRREAFPDAQAGLTAHACPVFAVRYEFLHGVSKTRLIILRHDLPADSIFHKPGGSGKIRHHRREEKGHCLGERRGNAVRGDARKRHAGRQEDISIKINSRHVLVMDRAGKRYLVGNTQLMGLTLQAVQFWASAYHGDMEEPSDGFEPRGRSEHSAEALALFHGAHAQKMHRHALLPGLSRGKLLVHGRERQRIGNKDELCGAFRWQRPSERVPERFCVTAGKNGVFQKDGQGVNTLLCGGVLPARVFHPAVQGAQIAMREASQDRTAARGPPAE